MNNEPFVFQTVFKIDNIDSVESRLSVMERFSLKEKRLMSSLVATLQKENHTLKARLDAIEVFLYEQNQGKLSSD